MASEIPILIEGRKKKRKKGGGGEGGGKLGQGWLLTPLEQKRDIFK